MNFTKNTEIQEHDSVFCIFKDCEDDINTSLKNAFKEFFKKKINMNESIEKTENKI